MRIEGIGPKLDQREAIEGIRQRAAAKTSPEKARVETAGHVTGKAAENTVAVSGVAASGSLVVKTMSQAGRLTRRLSSGSKDPNRSDSA